LQPQTLHHDERESRVTNNRHEVTDPLDLKLHGGWTLLPMPTARTWWRKPKTLAGSLGAYFAERD
jgi:hypothetical protein